MDHIWGFEAEGQSMRQSVGNPRCLCMQADRRKKHGCWYLCWFSVCMLPAAIATCFAQSSPSAASAEALIARGQFNKALQQLDAIAMQEHTPGHVEYLRGMAYYLNGGMIKAAASFAKAADQDPENLDAMQMEGVS